MARLKAKDLRKMQREKNPPMIDNDVDEEQERKILQKQEELKRRKIRKEKEYLL